MDKRFFSFDGTVLPHIQIGAKNSRLYQSTIEPTTTEARCIWINPNTREIKFRDDTNTSWATQGFASENYVDQAIAGITAGSVPTMFYHIDNSLTTINSLTPVTKSTFTFNVTVPGDYYIGTKFNYNSDTAARVAEWGVYLDTVAIDTISHAKVSSTVTGNWSSTGSSDQLSYSNFDIKTLAAGNHTIDVKLNVTDVTDKASMWNNAMYIWRIS